MTEQVLNRIEVSAALSWSDTFDLPQLIRDNLTHYRTFDQDDDVDDDFEPWQRPAEFLFDWAYHSITTDEGDLDMVDVDRIRWAKQDYENLIKVCPEARVDDEGVDPELLDRLPGPYDVPLPLDVP